MSRFPGANELMPPRVLWLADEIPQSAYAGGILLSRLFSGYPTDRLVVLGQPPHAEAELMPVRYEPLSLWWARLTRTRFARTTRSLHALGILPPFATSPAKLLGDFQPEVVVTLMQILPYYQVAARFARFYGLPLVSLVHDLPGKFDEVYPFAKGSQEAAIRRVYRQSQRRLCISPEMTTCLEDKYGVPGEVLYPIRSDAIVPRPLEHSRVWRNPQAFTVGYAGSVSYGYGETLAQLCRALPEAGFRFHYYGREDNTYLADFSSQMVVQRGFAPAETTWQRVQDECDAVILPYSFTEGFRELYATHFPSKLPEYLALHMPVVILGPSYATGVRWGLRNPRPALTVTETEPSAWIQALRSLAGSSAERLKLANGAYQAGERDFCPAKLKQQFLSALSESVCRETTPGIR